MRRINFKELLVKTQYRSDIKPYYFESFPAYDTETIDGKAILICDDTGNHIYPKNFEEAIKFITPKRNRGGIAWFYNITYDIEAILKWLDQDLIIELKDTGEIKNLQLENFDCTITIIDKKFTSIKRGKHSFTFFDISNFFKGGLDRNAVKYLGAGKEKIPIDFGKDSRVKIKKFLYSKQAIHYCHIDAKRTSQLAKLFVDNCNKFRIFAKNFASPASLATHYFQSCVKIPTLRQVSKGRPLATNLAYTAYKGGFIQTFKKGYFPKVTSYDINSAYPAALCKLPDMSKGNIESHVGDKVPENAYLGWLEVTVETINQLPYAPSYYSPLPVHIKKLNKNFYLTGKIHTYITLLEYEALKYDFNIKIIVGSYWIPGELDFLYKEAVENLYRLRQETTDENLNVVLKTILNGFYGKLIQKIPKKVNSTVYNEFHTGNLFQPFHASYITANCRIQVYEAIKKYGAHRVIAVMTDSICFEGDVYMPTSKELGGWSKDFKGECLMIGSGLYTLRNGDKIKTATRGFRLSSKLDFFKLCQENLDKKFIELDQNVRLSYREALRVKNFTGWNVINKSIKKININCDNKRNWSREFKNCGDVLKNTIDSLPISVIM